MLYLVHHSPRYFSTPNIWHPLCFERTYPLLSFCSFPWLKIFANNPSGRLRKSSQVPFFRTQFHPKTTRKTCATRSDRDTAVADMSDYVTSFIVQCVYSLDIAIASEVDVMSRAVAPSRAYPHTCTQFIFVRRLELCHPHATARVRGLAAT